MFHMAVLCPIIASLTNELTCYLKAAVLFTVERAVGPVLKADRQFDVRVLLLPSTSREPNKNQSDRFGNRMNGSNASCSEPMQLEQQRRNQRNLVGIIKRCRV